MYNCIVNTIDCTIYTLYILILIVILYHRCLLFCGFYQRIGFYRLCEESKRECKLQTKSFSFFLSENLRGRHMINNIPLQRTRVTVCRFCIYNDIVCILNRNIFDRSIIKLYLVSHTRA